MGRPSTPPATERGQEIVRHLQDKGHWPLTVAAAHAGVNFEVLFRIIHYPTSLRRIHAKTRAKLERLELPARLLDAG